MTLQTTSKLSMTIPTSVYKALEREAAEKRRDLHEHIQRVLSAHVIQTGSLVDEEARMIELFWKLVDRAVEVAKDICRRGEFESDITLKAIKKCIEDPEWGQDYADYVQDDIYKNGNPRKGPINREIGFRIRAGIGGEVVVGPNGKGATQRVLGEIIQSYTPMANYDPKAVDD